MSARAAPSGGAAPTPWLQAPHSPLPETVQQRYRREGFWNDQTLGSFCDALLREHAREELRIWSRERPSRHSLGEIRSAALRVAASLQQRGIGPGDAIAIQLPNWSEVAIAVFAASFLGAVVVPIVHFYGPKEVAFILRDSRARVYLTAERAGSQDFAAILAAVRPAAPELELPVIVGRAPEGVLPFERLLDAAPLPAPLAVDPATTALIAYTSGTTADPKGVIHSHQSFLAGVREVGNGMPGPRPYLVGSPVSHVMGMIGGFLYPLYRGKSIHWTDVWEPTHVLGAMRAGDLVFNWGPPYFVTSLLDSPEFRSEDLLHLQHVGLGGAPIPLALAERLEGLGICLVRAYGSTEQLTLSTTPFDAPAAKRLRSDGLPAPAAEVRLLDDEGREVDPGTPGEITSRSPRNFAGYTRPELTAAAFDAEGFFRSGDIAVADADGTLTIVDRKQDIIIRGGENISAAEVEDLVLRLPEVLEVAVVAAPDPRLGERVCAVLRLREGADGIELGRVQAHLQRAGLGKKKWPEELRLVSEFPRTPSGKIRKRDLRDALRQEAERSAGTALRGTRAAATPLALTREQEGVER